jgi:phosphoribosylamine-glycine ligase
MTVAILSSNSSYHQFAQLLAKTDKVIHYGAPRDAVETDTYVPVHVELAYDRYIQDSTFPIADMATRNIDYLLASGIPPARSDYLHNKLSKLNLPYFFPEKDLTALEMNKALCKKMLIHLGIPTAPGRVITAAELYSTFNSIPKPFVIKLSKYMHGRQTIIVNESNAHEVYNDLFSDQTEKLGRPTNVKLTDEVLIEDYIDLTKEYSYHALLNRSNWQYLGAARDYKKRFDNDVGFNYDSAGAYSVVEVDAVVHQYLDKIYNFLKEYKSYKGFLFLGIGIDSKGIPIVLEINTRAGDPELQVILPTIDNNLGELFNAAATDRIIPPVVHNQKFAVTICILNRQPDWTQPATYLPKLTNMPDNIMCGTENYQTLYTKHSALTCTADAVIGASRELYKYLDTQYVGQFGYRRDIGILK